jgi:predicted ATP-dependent endonuclease of OLD family
MLLIELWILHAKKAQKKNLPKREKLRILLVDEHGAHMHPSLIKEFIDLIANNQLEYLNFYVFMTTHSPVTLNFLNTKNIREIKVDASTKSLTIEPISVKSEIMKNLSDDLFFLKEKFLIVFVEGQ